MINYIVYISAAKKLMTDAELLEILTTSRDNNKTKGITGMLIYSEGTFIQVLEGDKEHIENTYNKISNDLRHKNLIKLAAGPLDQRSFPDWTMGFMTVNIQLMNELEGYINPAGENLLETHTPHAAVSILKTFVEKNFSSGL